MTSRRLGILFLSPRYPLPLDRGDNRRVFHLATALAAYADVTLACLGTGPPFANIPIRVLPVGKRGGSHRFHGPDLPHVLLANLLAATDRLPLQVRCHLDRRMFRLVKEHCVGRDAPDVIHATYSPMAPYLLADCKDSHRHLDFVDPLSVSLATQARATHSRARRKIIQREARMFDVFEAAVARSVDSSSVVSGADRRVVPALRSAAVIPNGVDAGRFPFQSPADRENALLFFGRLNYLPNVEAARWIASNTLPIIRKSVGDAELRLAGAAPVDQVTALRRIPGVALVGQVKDMVPEIHAAAVAVLPMFSGAGLKNKVLEAFACGTPVVTNRAGIEAVDGAIPGVHYFLAESAREVAEACIELLGDPDRRCTLAREAHRLVVNEYSWDKQAQRLLAHYAHS